MTDEIGTDFSGAPDITPEQLHDACIVLLGYAIGVAGCGKKTLRTMLRPVFEAIGAIGYEPGLSPDQWGTRRHGDKRGRVQQ